VAYDALTTLSSVKLWLNVPGTSDDARLSQLVSTSGDLIGRFCGRNNLGNVLTYQENYFPGQRSRGLFSPNVTWDLVLKHYPVVNLQSVYVNNAIIPILNNAGLQSGQQGCYLLDDEEQRVLRFVATIVYWSGMVVVNYTAGYPPSAVPDGLQQASNAHVAELFRTASWVGQKSVAMQGETTAFDMGNSWGMSDRVKGMLAPYRNVVPFGQR